MNTLYLKIMGAMLIVILALGGYAWYLQNEVKKERAEKEISQQNRQALSDSLTIERGKVTRLAASVETLKGEKNQIVVAYRSLISAYQDTIRIYKEVVAQWTDSTVRVPINGKYKIVTYDGFTLAQRGKSAIVSLSLSFDPIQVQSSLFFDKNDKLWKFQTESLTDGIMVKGTGVLDRATYLLLQENIPTPKPKNIGITAFATWSSLYGGATVRFSDDWYISPGYKLSSPKSDKFFENIIVGIHYFIF